MPRGLFESNHENNVGEFAVTIPDHPGKGGSGPMANSKIDSIDSDEHDPPSK